jgi:hypothetical protein
MALTKQEVRSVIDLYTQAWAGQDPDLITTVFTDTATYHERCLKRQYEIGKESEPTGQTKVVESQDNIKCELLNLYLDENTAIAEWEAQFDDVVRGVR